MKKTKKNQDKIEIKYDIYRTPALFIVMDLIA